MKRILTPQLKSVEQILHYQVSILTGFEHLKKYFLQNINNQKT